MKPVYHSLLLTLGALTGSGAAYGTQPPDVVTSDGTGNTAMGSSALLNSTSGYGNNTAAGYEALLNNTTGVNNTASGNSALLSNTQGASNTASGYSAL